MTQKPQEGSGLTGCLNSTTGLIIAITGLITAVGGLIFSLSKPQPVARPNQPYSEPPPAHQHQNEQTNWRYQAPPINNLERQTLFKAVSHCTETGATGYAQNTLATDASQNAIFNCVANGGVPQCCQNNVSISAE